MNDHDEYRVEEALARRTPSDADTPLTARPLTPKEVDELRFRLDRHTWPLHESVTIIPRLLATLDATRAAAGIDVAWAEALAVLPEGQDERALSIWWDNRKPAGWWAAASHRFAPTRPIPLVVKGFPTPAAALQALAAALRSTPDAPRPETL